MKRLTLGFAIRLARQIRGLTRQELSVKMGSTAHYIYMVESGRRHPSRVFVIAFCSVLGIKEDELTQVAEASCDEGFLNTVDTWAASIRVLKDIGIWDDDRCLTAWKNRLSTQSSPLVAKMVLLWTSL